MYIPEQDRIIRGVIGIACFLCLFALWLSGLFLPTTRSIVARLRRKKPERVRLCDLPDDDPRKQALQGALDTSMALLCDESKSKEQRMKEIAEACRAGCEKYEAATGQSATQGKMKP